MLRFLLRHAPVLDGREANSRSGQVRAVTAMVILLRCERHGNLNAVLNELWQTAWLLAIRSAYAKIYQSNPLH